MMPSVGSNINNSTLPASSIDIIKKNMDGGDEDHNQPNQRSYISHTSEYGESLGRESATNTSSSEDVFTKMKSGKTEDSIPNLQISPGNSVNMFTSEDEDDDNGGMIPPSPENYGPVSAASVLPGTPSRNSPLQSDHSNGTASSITGSNHSKNSYIRPGGHSKRITFSQDSSSQIETPIHTKFQIAEFVQRNVELNTDDRQDYGSSLKRPIKEVNNSSSDSSDKTISFPKRRRDVSLIDETAKNNRTIMMNDRTGIGTSTMTGSPFKLTTCSNNVEPNNSQLEEFAESDCLDSGAIRLYLSGTDTICTPNKKQTDSEEPPVLKSAEMFNTAEVSNAKESLESGQWLTTEIKNSETTKFSLNLPEALEATDSFKESTPETSIFAKVEQNQVSKSSTQEERLTPTVAGIFNASDQADILQESSTPNYDSNLSLGLGHNSFELSSEASALEDNVALLKTNRGRNRILDTQNIPAELLSQASVTGSQKRAHSSDENEPKKNQRTRDIGAQTPDLSDIEATNTPTYTKFREKIVKLTYKDDFSKTGILIKSTMISEVTISESSLSRTHSSQSTYSSLTSGDLADHSSLPLSKSTGSSENLNVTSSSTYTLNSGPLDISKGSSTLSLERSPPVLKPQLPISAISAKKTMIVTSSSSASDEPVFKTPNRTSRGKKSTSAKKESQSLRRKVKGSDTVKPVDLETAEPAKPEIPNLTTEEDDAIDPCKICTGVRVMAKWGDGYYYPGKIGNKTGIDKWEVKFDDGNCKEVKTGEFFPAALIKPGQSVLALSTDHCFDPGVIQEFYREENEEGYVVDLDKGYSTRCKRDDVILSVDQASALISPISPMLASKLLSPDLNLDNIVDGKRRRTATSTLSASKFSSRRGKSHRDPILESTSDYDSSSDSNTKSKIIPRGSQARLTLLADYTPTKSKEPEETLVATNPKRSPSSRRSPKSNFCTACGKIEENHSHSCTKSSPMTRKKQTPNSRGSSEIRKPGANSPRKSPVKVKRALENEFDKLIQELPKEKSKLFHGLYFLISCADRCTEQDNDSSTSVESKSPSNQVALFNKEYLLKLLELGGGNILQSFEETPQAPLKKIVLISNTYLRTLKYIKCLASGIPCILFNWVLDCYQQRKRLDYRGYYLPAGFNIVDKSVIPSHGCNTVLKGLHILLSSKSNSMFLATWKPVLLAAQAEAVHSFTNDKSTHACLVNVVVADQSCPGHVVRRANDLSIPIVSSEWVIQCLINGKQLPFNAHKKFNYLYDEN